jgi:hypothetical protein
MKIWSVTLLTAVLVAAGCATHEGAYSAKHKTGSNLETREKFVLLDEATQQSVTYTGLQERRLADGRLEVNANIMNRLNRRIEVQVSCVFKDAQGFATETETPFRTLILTENAQEGVHFVSLNENAQTYTIRVRQAR